MAATVARPMQGLYKTPVVSDRLCVCHVSWKSATACSNRRDQSNTGECKTTCCWEAEHCFMEGNQSILFLMACTARSDLFLVRKPRSVSQWLGYWPFNLRSRLQISDCMAWLFSSGNFWEMNESQVWPDGFNLSFVLNESL